MFSWILDQDMSFWLLAGLTGFIYLTILSLLFGLLLFAGQKITERHQQCVQEGGEGDRGLLLRDKSGEAR